MSDSKPICTGENHSLPLDALSPESFERLCLWLVKREGFQRCEHLGASGSDSGRDITGWKGGDLFTFQCKRTRQFGFQQAAKEVAKLLSLPETIRPAVLVFVATCNVSATVRERIRGHCREGGLECHFWSGTDLDERIKRHGDLLSEFFQVARVGGLGSVKHSSPGEQGKSVKWWNTWIGGASFRLEAGIAGTRKMPSGHHPSLFPFESTVILGDSGKCNPRNPEHRTIAHWTISTSEFPLALYTRGYLLVACLRRFGGLHSPTCKDRAEILLNGDVLDGFELQHVPQGHRDYFHQIPYPDAPRILPFSGCETVYSWSVPKSHLRASEEQLITVRLDRDTKWDIDYIGFLFQTPEARRGVFISHNSNDKELARRIANDLKSRGIGVWIDNAEIKLGDSLIQKICEGIDSVDYVLVLLSRHSVNSAWVNKEVEIAMNQEIRGKRVKVFVVLIDEVELPSFLKDKRYADLRSSDRYEEVLIEIERRVTL